MAKKKEQRSEDLFFNSIAENVNNTNRLIENAVFSDVATRSEVAFRRRPEVEDRMRAPFERDRHRIIFSTGYRGYRGRTQVFILANYQIADRMVHVNYVAQVARMLAKALKLNSDLAEAIAVAHDIGHAPFGHDGEKILNDISLEYKLGEFHHNIQGVRVVDVLERGGRGLNLTFQVRDGIFSHDGEVHNVRLLPEKNKDEKTLQAQMKALTDGKRVRTFPATMEGCVMRVSDTIAYIGSDIEDAIRLGIIKMTDLPKKCLRILGNTNGEIIDTIISDIIRNSYEKEYVSFSDDISEAVKMLKGWNYHKIYVPWKESKAPVYRKWQEEQRKVKEGLYKMFETFSRDIESGNDDSLICQDFLDKMSDAYLTDKKNTALLKVRDYITTMTDEYAANIIAGLTVPKPMFTGVNAWIHK